MPKVEPPQPNPARTSLPREEALSQPTRPRQRARLQLDPTTLYTTIFLFMARNDAPADDWEEVCSSSYSPVHPIPNLVLSNQEYTRAPSPSASTSKSNAHLWTAAYALLILPFHPISQPANYHPPPVTPPLPPARPRPPTSSPLRNNSNSHHSFPRRRLRS